MKPEIGRLILVWAALLGLLAVTVAGALLPYSALRLGSAYGIAAIKAALVVWYFMDMRREGAVARFAMIAAGLWLLMMLTLIGADYATRALLAP